MLNRQRSYVCRFKDRGKKWHYLYKDSDHRQGYNSPFGQNIMQILLSPPLYTNQPKKGLKSFLLRQFTEFYGKRWQALPPSQASKAYPLCYTDAVPRNYYNFFFIYWRICDQFRNCSKIRFRAVNNAFVAVQVYKFLAIYVNPLAPATKL